MEETLRDVNATCVCLCVYIMYSSWACRPRWPEVMYRYIDLRNTLVKLKIALRRWFRIRFDRYSVVVLSNIFDLRQLGILAFICFIMSFRFHLNEAADWITEWKLAMSSSRWSPFDYLKNFCRLCILTLCVTSYIRWDNTNAVDVFSRTLQLHYKFRYSHKMLSVVCNANVLWQNRWS